LAKVDLTMIFVLFYFILMEKWGM